MSNALAPLFVPLQLRPPYQDLRQHIYALLLGIFRDWRFGTCALFRGFFRGFFPSIRVFFLDL